MIDLLIQYRKSKRGLIQMIAELKRLEQDTRDKLSKTDSDDDYERLMNMLLQTETDKKMLNSMVGSISEIIDWLESGKDPRDFQGINKKHAYDIASLPDMDIFPDLAEVFQVQEREPLKISKERKEIIAKVFSSFSKRERECFSLHVGHNWSMSEIANELGIAKTTVQNHIDRARRKITEVVPCGTIVVRSRY